MKRRLDDVLVDRKMAGDRRQAAALIMSGAVLLEGQRTDKPGSLIDPAGEIRLKKKRGRYVSRGGEKLEGALEDLGLDVGGLICLDLGASTGGFTDCLLQHGARMVYAFDVGRGVLDWKLRQDPRVVVREGVNVRNLLPAWVEDPLDLVVADLSFISLRRILPTLRGFPPLRALVLVKPQFEGRREEVGEGGVVPDAALQREIVDRVRAFSLELGLRVLGEAPSRLAGRKGNQEYFLLLGSG